jgi:hypothetical protein
MSRSAVSGEVLVNAAHFEEVSLPSKPSSKRLIALRWRSFGVLFPAGNAANKTVNLRKAPRTSLGAKRKPGEEAWLAR